MELGFPFPARIKPPPPFYIPSAPSSSPTAVTDQRSQPPLPTPVGDQALPLPRRSWADNYKLFPHLGRSGEVAGLNHSPFPATPLPQQAATPHAQSEVTAPGIKLGREGDGLLAVPWELADTTLQSPGKKVSLFLITSQPALRPSEDVWRVPGAAVGAVEATSPSIPP